MCMGTRILQVEPNLMLDTQEILTALKDSVIDLGSLPQGHSLLHQGRHSVLFPVFRGEKNNSTVNLRK